MAEPDNLVLEILKELRTEMREGFQRTDARFEALERRFVSLEDRIDRLEIKLDGLTHAMLSGFGSIVRELKDLDKRMTTLEAVHA
jgi:predicted  nucleic acid-binding Zn-ribbon protein